MNTSNLLKIAKDIAEACSYAKGYGWQISSCNFDPEYKTLCIVSAIKLKSIKYEFKENYSEFEYNAMYKYLSDKMLLNFYPDISTIRDALGIMWAIEKVSKGTIIRNKMNKWFQIVIKLKEIGEFDNVVSTIFGL